MPRHSLVTSQALPGWLQRHGSQTALSVMQGGQPA